MAQTDIYKKFLSDTKEYSAFQQHMEISPKLTEFGQKANLNRYKKPELTSDILLEHHG